MSGGGGGASSYGVGLDLKEDKIGYSTRLSSSSNSHHNSHHHHTNSHHHQYNQYHRISGGANGHHQQQQQQQFNCSYMPSSSNSRGRLSVHNNGYYGDSMSSKLIANSQNYNGGHYDSIAQSYSLSSSSSIGMKSYREFAFTILDFRASYDVLF